MKEVWKNINDYPYYLISNLGRIKSKERFVKNGMGALILKKEKILKTSKHNGYVYVNLYKNKINKRISVHRLVAFAFLKVKHNKKEVNHIDGVRDNNIITNLEWVSREENQQHSWKILKRISPNQGNKCCFSVLSEMKVFTIREWKKIFPLTSDKIISDKFKIHKTNVSRIRRNIFWKHLPELI